MICSGFGFSSVLPHGVEVTRARAEVVIASIAYSEREALDFVGPRCERTKSSFGLRYFFDRWLLMQPRARAVAVGELNHAQCL